MGHILDHNGFRNAVRNQLVTTLFNPIQFAETTAAKPLGKNEYYTLPIPAIIDGKYKSVVFRYSINHDEDVTVDFRYEIDMNSPFAVTETKVDMYIPEYTMCPRNEKTVFLDMDAAAKSIKTYYNVFYRYVKLREHYESYTDIVSDIKDAWNGLTANFFGGTKHKAALGDMFGVLYSTDTKLENADKKADYGNMRIIAENCYDELCQSLHDIYAYISNLPFTMREEMWDYIGEHYLKESIYALNDVYALIKLIDDRYDNTVWTNQ